MLSTSLRTAPAVLLLPVPRPLPTRAIALRC